MSTLPVHIKLSAPGGVAITWDDGHSASYPYTYLREQCPCATCTQHGAIQPPKRFPSDPFALPILGQGQVQVVGATQVGHYAVQFNFSDGHTSGIYSYTLLRELCPCPDCRGSGRSDDEISPDSSEERR